MCTNIYKHKFVGDIGLEFYYGFVWIWLILLKLKTYCWNHCSKIIFKCVNNTVGPIFNEKIDKKWNLWVRKQCTDVLFTENWSKVVATVHVPYINSSRKWGENAWKQKKKKKNKTQTWFMKRESTQRHNLLKRFVLVVYPIL